MGVTWAGCIEGRPIPYDGQETAPSASVPCRFRSASLC
jgi:hypothetical protein